MADLLADEHIPDALTNALRRLGHCVTTVRQTNVNKSGDGDSDEQVLLYAIKHKQAVLTFNERHFRPLARTYPMHYGVIFGHHSSDYRKQARRLTEQLKLAGRLQGKIIVLPRAIEGSKKARRKRN
jgi:hypothetical protein